MWLLPSGTNADQKPTFAETVQELAPSSGDSIKDTVHRIDVRLDEMNGRLATLTARFDDHLTNHPAGTVALSTALSDNTITAGEGVTIALAVLGAFGVYAIPNRAKPIQSRDSQLP